MNNNIEVSTIPKKRPTIALLISVCFLIPSIMSIVSSLIVLSGYSPLGDIQLSPIEFSLPIIINTLAIVSAIFLLKLSRWAFYLFLSLTILEVTVWSVNSFDIESSYFPILVSTVIMLAVCGYIWSLVKDGTLE